MLDDVLNLLFGALPWQLQVGILVAVISAIGVIWFLVTQ